MYGLDPKLKAVYHLFVIEIEHCDDLKKHLQMNGVACGIHYPIRLPMQSAYSYLRCKESDFPEALYKSCRILSPPMVPELTTKQQDYVIDKIAEFYR